MGAQADNPLRIALLLASIHTGSSEALWTGIADTAQASGQALFVFPGGRLDAPGEFEYLRNSIYRLVNSATVDAVISWGSSLSGTVDQEKTVAFHTPYSSLPLVSIALPIPGAQVISFDAYQGMKTMVLHCIRKHGAKRIAFIRGPENHVSAQERYHAYLDALHEADLDPDPLLVSSPQPWHRGANALAELLDERHLIPAKDFSMICCASDLLMLNAAKVLEKKGYRIPQDVGLVGFNDSAESRFLSVPGTTVRVPFSELGKVAHKALMRRLSGIQETQDIVLPAEPVIRSSCGCSLLEQGAIASATPFTRQDLHQWAVKRFSLDREQQDAYLNPLLDSLYGASTGKKSNLRSLVRTVLDRYFLRESDTSAFQQVIEALSRTGDLDATYVREVVRQAQGLALETQSRIANRHSYENIQQAQLLNAFKCDLLKAWDRQSLVQIMQQHLPRLGISQAYLVMDENEIQSRYVGGFSNAQPIGIPDELFASHRLLPQTIEANVQAGVHLVQPLFIENQVLGYLVFTISDRNSLKYEELRSSISSALKGVLLFEEMTKAKEAAERAEQAELTFFAAMGESIKDPLRSFIGTLRDLEAAKSTDTHVSLGMMRRAMEEHLDHIRLLFDQTLAQVGSLEIERQLIDVESLLRGVCARTVTDLLVDQPIPRIIGDAHRIDQSVSLAVEAFRTAGRSVSVTLCCSAHGLRVTIRSDREPDKQVAVPPLVESLLLLHGGTYRQQGPTCTMTIPWPRLGEHPGGLPEEAADTLLVLSDAPTIDARAIAIAESCTLQVRVLKSEQVLTALSETTERVIVFWDANDAQVNSSLALLRMSRQHGLCSIPVLAFGSELDGAPSVVAAAERLLRSRQASPVLAWRGAADLSFCNSLQVESVPVQDVERLRQVVQEVGPSCMLMLGFDLTQIEAVRATPGCSSLPLAVIIDVFPPSDLLDRLIDIPHVLLCHAAIAAYPEFCDRIRDIVSGKDILPSHTGILVKRAQHYIARYGCSSITRWKIAGSVNTSEDYLTRIFKRELGMSPWEYLNRYRVEQAVRLLRETDLPLSEVAMRCGFQDQAYFCRVFKKLKGATPGSLRNG